MDNELPDLDSDRDNKELLNIKALNGNVSKDKSISHPASASALNGLTTKVSQDINDIKSEMNNVKRRLEQMLATLKAKNQATANPEVLDVKPKILRTSAPPNKPVQEKSTSTVEANKKNETPELERLLDKPATNKNDKTPELEKLLDKPATNKKNESAELKRLLEKRPSIPTTLQSHIGTDSVMGQLAALVKREIVTRESSEVVASKQPRLDIQQPEDVQESSSLTQEVIINVRQSPTFQRPEISFQVGEEEEQNIQNDFTVNGVDQPICFELQLVSDDLTNNAQIVEQAFQITTPATIVDQLNSSYRSRKSSTRRCRKPNKAYKPGMYCFSCLNLITLKTFNWKRQTQCKACFRQLNFKLCTACNEWKQHRAAGKCSTCYNSLSKTKPVENSLEGSSTQPSSVSEISQLNSPASLNGNTSPGSLIATTTSSSTTPDLCITCKIQPSLIQQMCRNCYVDKFKVKDTCRGCKEERPLLSIKKQLCRECLFNQKKKKPSFEVNVENVQTDANPSEVNIGANVEDKQSKVNEKSSENKINLTVAEILNGKHLTVETNQLAPENVHSSTSSILKSPKRKQKQAEDECTIVATVEYQDTNDVPNRRKPTPFRRICKKCEKPEILDKFGLCQLCFYSHFNSTSSKTRSNEEPRPEFIVCFSCNQTKLRFCGKLCSECFTKKTCGQEVVPNKPTPSVQLIQQVQPTKTAPSLQKVQSTPSTKETEEIPGSRVQKARDQLAKTLQRRIEEPVGHYTNQIQVNQQHHAHQQPNQTSELARILQNNSANLFQAHFDNPVQQKRGFRLFNCTGCDRFVKYFAKDLCQRCYQRQRSQLRREQQQEVTKVNQSAEDNQLMSSLMTHFYPHASFPLVSATRSFAEPVGLEPVSIVEQPTNLSKKLPQTSTMRQELYCICRQKSQGAMILCDNPDCSIGWYHFKCVNLSVGPPSNVKCQFNQPGTSTQNALVNNVVRQQSFSTNLPGFLTTSLQKLINKNDQSSKKVDLVCLISSDEDEF